MPAMPIFRRVMSSTSPLPPGLRAGDAFWDVSRRDNLTIRTSGSDEYLTGISTAYGDGAFSQSTETLQPKLVADASGVKYARTDGVDDVLNGDATIEAMLQDVSGGSVFVIGHWETAPSTTQQLLALSNGLSAGQIRLGIRGVSSSYEAGARRLDADSYYSVTGGSGPTSKAIFGSMADYTGQTLTVLRANGTLTTAAKAWGSGNTSNTASVAASLGSSGQAFRAYGWGVFPRAITESEWRSIRVWASKHYRFAI